MPEENGTFHESAAQFKHILLTIKIFIWWSLEIYAYNIDDLCAKEM